MKPRVTAGLILGLLPLMELTACGPMANQRGDDGYWNNQRWDGLLLDAAQSAIQYPLDERGRPIGNPATVKGKVQFTYADAQITDPLMVESTGRPDLDAVMMHQLSTARAPLPFGPHAQESHDFQLELTMLSPLDEFAYQLRVAVDRDKVYPKEAVLSGSQGLSAISFDYMSGKAFNVYVLKSSGDKTLDKSALQAVLQAQFPPPPAWLGAKPLNFHIAICYALGNSDFCGQAMRTVIQVTNTLSDQSASPPSGS